MNDLPRFSGLFTTAALLTALVCAIPTNAAELPNGVASGDVTDTSVYLWARPAVAGDVDFVYGTDPTLTTGTTPFTLNTADPNVPVKTQVTGLTPGTTYYYSATDANGNISTGTFNTAHSSGFNGLRFGVAGDWRGELSPYPAIKNAPSRGLDFFVGLGDTIYADFPTPDLPIEQAASLADFRTKHNEVYSERSGLNTLADLRQSTSVFASIDDHEVTNDFRGFAITDDDTAGPGGTSRFLNAFPSDTGLPVNDSQLYDNGLQAFQEYNPIGNEFYPGVDNGLDRIAGERKLYRFRQFGDDAAMAVLDARSFRDEAVNLPQAQLLGAQAAALGEQAATLFAEGQALIANNMIPEGQAKLLESQNLANQATDLGNQAQGIVGQLFDPTRTLLSTTQKEDLIADLTQAQQDGVTWKFVMIPEPIQQLGALAAEDRYEGFFAERNELLGRLEQNGVENVVFIAADIHGSIVNDLSYYDQAFNKQQTNYFEVTTGSLAFSSPFGQTVEGFAASPAFLLFSDPQVQAAAVGFGLVTPTEIQNAVIANTVNGELDDVTFNQAMLALIQDNPIALRNAFEQELLNAQFAMDPVFDPILGDIDPIGLETGEGIDFTVHQGDNPLTTANEAFFQTFTYGWTEFEIDETTGELWVTTYGIEAYSEEDLLNDLGTVLSREPEIVSQFSVAPVPEPTSLVLLGLGGLLLTRRRRRA